MADQLASETIAYPQKHRLPSAPRHRASSAVALSPSSLLTALLVVLTVVPLATVVIGSFRPFGLPLSPGWTFEHYVTIWSDPYTYALLKDTLIFALGSTALSIVIALTLALLLERTDLPGRRFFATAILMPMVTPPLLLAIGWALILEPAYRDRVARPAAPDRTGRRLARHLHPARA